MFYRYESQMTWPTSGGPFPLPLPTVSLKQVERVVDASVTHRVELPFETSPLVREITKNVLALAMSVACDQEHGMGGPGTIEENKREDI